MRGEEAARALTIVVHVGWHLILVPGLGAKRRAWLAAASIEIPRHLLTQASILARGHQELLDVHARRDHTEW